MGVNPGGVGVFTSRMYGRSVVAAAPDEVGGAPCGGGCGLLRASGCAAAGTREFRVFFTALESLQQKDGDIQQKHTATSNSTPKKHAPTTIKIREEPEIHTQDSVLITVLRSLPHPTGYREREAQTVLGLVAPTSK